MKRVICTGLAVLDHVFYLQEIPKKPIKSFVTNYQTVGGGNAATAAVAINPAGGKAIFWGSLGDDLNGDIILSELKEFGIEIAIDDFGTGFSSLSYLQKLPLDRLKIDRAFIKDLPGQDCQAIAALIISLGARLGLKTIAEGVETQAQADYLAQLGCDEVQGFMYAKPMPEKELITYLQAKQ